MSARRPTMGLEPRYQHDCDACVFVAHYKGYDVWDPVHEESGSLVARTSSEGPDYQSGERVLLSYAGGEEWLSHDDLPGLRARVERILREPELIAAIRAAGGHPAPKARLSDLSDSLDL